MPVQPRMLATAPAQILLHDAVQRRGVPLREAEGRGENDVATMMKNRVVVAKLHIVRPNGAPLVLFAEDLARLEDLGDEHGAFTLRGRR